MKEDRKAFNLIDDPWIPVVDAGRVGLRQIFSNPEYRAIGGNPAQKIAVLKLLQAIAMRAAPASHKEAWAEMGAEGMSERCLSYLEKWHHRFFLYGDEPFLQMPSVRNAQLQSYGAVLPDIATGNTSVLTQWQIERWLDDGERALLLVFLMSFAFGGKKVDNTIVLTPGYSGKTKSARAGPAIATRGLLHNFVLGKNIQRTIWLNMFTEEEIRNFGIYPSGVGVPPWEKMPEGEACQVAENLKSSLMGRLVPMCRFCFFREEGLNYSEGLQHMNYLEGIYDPSVAVNARGKKIKTLWADPEKRPWRQLPALLGFITQGRGEFDCFQLRASLPKAREYEESFAVWSGGIKVSSNAGEQYVSGSDDFVESEVWLPSDAVGELWFNNLQNEMKGLEDMARVLYASIKAYFNAMNSEGDLKAAQGTGLFWELCEQDFQELIDACAAGNDSQVMLKRLHKRFAARVSSIYDRCCPNETARQMEAWARCRPRLGKFFRGEVS